MRLRLRSRRGRRYDGPRAYFDGLSARGRVPWPGTYRVKPNGRPDRRGELEWIPVEGDPDGGYFVFKGR